MDGLVELVASPLGQAFVRRALGAGLALGAAGALVGVFVVQRGLGLVADGLAHATFDPELARISGVPVAALESLLLALTALVVVVGVRTVGVVLVSAFVVIPAATALLVGRTLGGILALSLATSLVATAAGLFASYHLNVAPGATIILTLGVLFSLALALRRR